MTADNATTEFSGDMFDWEIRTEDHRDDFFYSDHEYDDLFSDEPFYMDNDYYGPFSDD